MWYFTGLDQLDFINVLSNEELCQLGYCFFDGDMTEALLKPNSVTLYLKSLESRSSPKVSHINARLFTEVVNKVKLWTY